MRPAILMTLALLAGCNQYDPVGTGNDLDPSDGNVSALDPGAKPVRIGEGGPGFDACIARGTVVNVAPGDRVALRAAPLNAAAPLESVSAGTRLYVCTRSIDQRWLGVVILPPSPVAEASDSGAVKGDPCGVDTAVDSPRNYDGPCKSGWIPSALVRMHAD